VQHDGRRAAQYLRMSTDMQQYSLANQAEAIGGYAHSHGYTIVRTYQDGAKSGLRLQGRAALANLIHDVISGTADFSTILIYDVSRWGRFQDTDEGAYYEFILKRAGVRIEYCAEPFHNDGTLTATIVKNIKRAMAGEYSRELSTKVHAGQARMVQLGYYIGGAPGFGLRRALVDQQGAIKFEMRSGERKSLHTEHTILVPGPPDEIAIVHRVYQLFLDERKSVRDIVSWLNASGTRNGAGGPWSYHSVNELLSNEKYAGTSVYNRTSKKLKANWQRNPSDQWIRRPGAFQPIVPMERLQAAQRRLQRDRRKHTEWEMLATLCAIWCKEKFLSRKLIAASAFAPSDNTYKARFGSLANAFRLIRFSTPRSAARELRQDLRRSVTEAIIQQFLARGCSAEQRTRCKCEFRINGHLDLTVVLGRASKSGAAMGQNDWQFGYRSAHKPHILIVARTDRGASTVRDYFVLPFAFLPPGTWVTVSGRNYARLERFQLTSIAPLVERCVPQCLARPSA